MEQSRWRPCHVTIATMFGETVESRTDDRRFDTPDNGRPYFSFSPVEILSYLCIVPPRTRPMPLPPPWAKFRRKWKPQRARSDKKHPAGEEGKRTGNTHRYRDHVMVVSKLDLGKSLENHAGYRRLEFLQKGSHFSSEVLLFLEESVRHRSNTLLR